MGTSDTPAGCELDDLIATRVMGWRRGINNTALWYFNAPGEKYAGHHVGSDWQPSRDIGDAWRVVERFATIAIGKLGPEPAAYVVSIMDDATGAVRGHGEAPTAPLAICRAALAATLR